MKITKNDLIEIQELLEPYKDELETWQDDFGFTSYDRAIDKLISIYKSRKICREWRPTIYAGPEAYPQYLKDLREVCESLNIGYEKYVYNHDIILYDGVDCFEMIFCDFAFLLD